MSIAVSFLLSVGVLWALYNMLCGCVTERFSIVHRAYLWTGKRDINVMAPHYLCHFARYALFFYFHSFTAFVRELTVNDNNVNDTNLSCHIRVFLYFFFLSVHNCHQWALFYFPIISLFARIIIIHCYHFILVRFTPLAVIPFEGSYCYVILSRACDHL